MGAHKLAIYGNIHGLGGVTGGGRLVKIEAMFFMVVPNHSDLFFKFGPVGILKVIMLRKDFQTHY